MHSLRSSSMSPDPTSAAARNASLVVCGGVGVPEGDCSDLGLAGAFSRAVMISTVAVQHRSWQGSIGPRG
jgi:hypothetical protein